MHVRICALLAWASLALYSASPAQRVQVSPGVRYVVSDSKGKHESVTRYSPCVTSERTPLKLDLSQDGNGEILTATVVTYIKGDEAYFTAELVWQLHLGVTCDYEDESGGAHGETVRRFTTTMQGRVRLGKEIELCAGEDIDDAPFILLTFNKTSGPESPCRPHERQVGG